MASEGSQHPIPVKSSMTIIVFGSSLNVELRTLLLGVSPSRCELKKLVP